MDSDRIRGHLSMLLLSVLASGPAHGYALSAELRRRSDGLLAVVEGSLYPALHRLERAGLVASSWEVSDGRRRRSYELTVDGKDTLKDEVEMWRQFQRAVNAVVGQIPVTQDDLIAAYLRDVDALLDTDDRQRQRVLSEIDGHLRDSAAEHADQGASMVEAADLAIREFGPPQVVAAGFAADLTPAPTIHGVRRWLPALLPALCFVPALALLLWSLTWIPGGRTLGQQEAQTTIVQTTAIALVLLVGALWSIRNAVRDRRWRLAAWSCSVLAVLVLVL